MEKIKSTLPYKVSGKSLRSECSLHDTYLLDIRLALSKKSIVTDYKTENVLQCCREYRENNELLPFIELNSDAAISVRTKVGKLHLAVEYEHSKKSAVRYRAKIDDYYRNNSVQGMLYVCGDKYILDSILRVDKEVSKSHQADPKLYCLLLNDVISDVDELKFRNVDRYIFRVS